jgi:hypothetical protein
MSKETWEIVTSREIEEAELMLALQCAPLIAGLKISNLLNIPQSYFSVIKRMLAGSDISWYVLLRSEEKMSVLLYREESLKSYLNSSAVQALLVEYGYRKLELDDILREFCVRYERYMMQKEFFPHEMGLLLGYPVEDVTGFIRNRGERALCTGYWKVYDNKDRKMRLFQSFENAKERMIQLLSCGMSMADIIHACHANREIGCLS